MTVKRIVAPNKYIGDTGEQPTHATDERVKAGDTFYDRQTGIMYITYDGTTWVEKDTIVRLETSPSIDIGDVTLLAGTAVVGKARLVDSGGTEVTETTDHSVNVTLVADDVALATSAKQLAAGHTVTLAAGTANAGVVGHNKTGVGHGVKTVSTAGSHEALVASTIPAKVVIIQAQTDNTDAIAVGATGVDATIATGNGIILYAGDSITLEVDDLIDVFIDALVAGEGARYTYLS